MGRNKYVGKWTETEAKKIDVQFTRENLDFLLEKIISREGLTFSHQDFANWCEDFFWDIERKEQLNADDTEDVKVSKILNDISAQWELYLVNTYSLEELQKLNFPEVKLPVEWFTNWLNLLRSSDT